MRTISVDISDLEYQKFGLPADRLSFSDFVNIVSRELSRQNLAKSVELAERYGLSSMTMDEISAEVKAVRSNNAADSEPQLKKSDDFMEFLLNGPVYSDKTIGVIEENRKSIAAWRTND